MSLPILIVEDDDDLRDALTDTLQLGGHSVLTASDGEAALRCLETERVALVLSDVQMQPMDGETLLLEVKQRYPWLPVMLMTAYGVVEKAVAALHAGACHYLPKPFEPDQLLHEVVKYMLPGSEDDTVIAEDPAMRGLLDMARRVAGSDASVLISGESGTGKEVLARFIHRASMRVERPFVAVNCAAVPEQLLESTFFGHERGAFTGAANQHIGKFEQANGGTLLLDEVTEMPLALQAKLLRVLQEREVERVGGTRAIRVDVRVIATSNRDIAQAVAAGQFREDLFYRLNVFPLHLPALRERPSDILPLARAMLARHAARVGRRAPLLAADAERRLEGYGWEGNVRELDNVIQRALILAPGDVILAEHLYLPQGPAKAAVAPLQARSATPIEEPQRPTDIKALEKHHILETLKACGGVRKLAAQKLAMSERTLRHKLQQYREEDGTGPA
ncbi:sigma-54 dependent transcriptional regulator [Chitiniphilus purpureus]|uniref:Sigma-54 dependent transcriptional regulator n=1 Tax=Chitiniphilus purpureus TaxID=2981137 RepID=A0ABY6DJQ5_9NEIS|nr:sigma-54 dependent transcriptional regulator [Chitiniphilus sp. CD1]UXY14594.1 sigma-54 dependent transcriptional regulator [Chitiniphilus sp. CD1]